MESSSSAKPKKDTSVSKTLIDVQDLANSISLRLANSWNAVIPVGTSSSSVNSSPKISSSSNFLDDFSRSSWYSQKEINRLSGSCANSDTEENTEITIWLLGRSYHISQLDIVKGKLDGLEHLLSDFQSQPWFTYRHHFPQLKPSSFTTDSGWGCMLRTGQALLGQALFRHYLGRDWKLKDNQNPEIAKKYMQVLEWFVDDMSPRSPFSIHRIALLGKQLNTKIGEWFGPYTMAQVLRHLVDNFNEIDINVVVNTDGAVYKSSILSGSSPDSLNFKPTLILLPIRLGVDSLNPIYFNALKKYFEFPQIVGIAGGKPSSSFYFMGVEDDVLIYHDPHHSRPALANKKSWSPEDFSSYHCSQPQRFKIDSIDPCMLIGFFCETKEEFIDFCDRSEALSQDTTPVFRVLETPPVYQEDLDFGTDSDEGGII